MTPPSGARAAILVLALWAAGLCAAAQLAKVSVAFEALTVTYPGAGTAMGWLLSLVGLLGIALGLFTGMIGARIGARALLLAALALGAVLSLVQAVLPPFPILLGLRVIEGLSHLGIAVAAPTLIGTLTPPAWRPAAMTLWGTFFAVAYALTAWLGGPVVATHGPHALFAAHGIAAGVTGAVLLVLLPSGALRPPQKEPPGMSLRSVGVVARHQAAYAAPATLVPALGWLFYNLTFVALLTVLPSLVAPDDRTFVATAMPIANIAVSLTIGVALLRVASAVSVVGLGFALGIVGAATMIAFGPAPWLCVALVGALGLIQGASFAAVPELNPGPAAQALANGARVQMGNLGNVLGTPVLLTILAQGGTGAMLGTAVGCYATAIGVGALLLRYAPRAEAGRVE